MVVVAVLVAASSMATAEIYRYVDDDGRLHMTDSLQQVPPQYRGQLDNLTEELRERGNLSVVEGINPPLPGAADPEPEAAVPDAEDLERSLQELGAPSLDSLGVGVLVGLLLLVPLGFLATAGLLMVACNWAAPEVPRFGRACLIVLVEGLANMALGIVFALVIWMFLGAASLESPLVNAASTVFGIAVNAVVLSQMLEDVSFGRGVVVTLLHMALCFLAFVIPVVGLVIAMGGSPG